MTNDRMNVPLPMRMRTLAKDARGYPIPFLVVIDKSGTPQFTINDSFKAKACVNQHLCAICGKRFDRHPITAKREMWFVGGSRCFLHDHGAFLDPPLHVECAEYALRVCPFLAAPRSWNKRIDMAKLKPEDVPDGVGFVQADHVQPDLPERFGLGLCHAYRIVGTRLQPYFVVDDWHHIEWWRGGECINAPDTAEPPPIPMEAA